MRALVVFESMFGNTQAIADAVADGLASRMSVDVVEVSAAPPQIGDGVDLLVVGGPTHAFGMTRPATRRSAAEQVQGELVSKGSGIREWLTALPADSARMAAAAFDTRIRKPRLPGSAARAAQNRLRRLGFRIITPAETFYVEGTQGPLLNDEAERARRWGKEVALSAVRQVGAHGNA